MDTLTLKALQNVSAAAAEPADGSLAHKSGDGSSGSSSGNSLPVTGKSAPEPSSAPPIEIVEVSIEQAVAQIQDYISQSERDLQFRVDEASGRTVVSVFGGTGELIRQYPSAEILKIAAALQTQGLNLLDQLA